MNKTSQRSGFTLIELLVVISIIALLAGLAFPALQGAMEAAQKAQASTMCNQMSIACTLYNTEYGVWPTYNNSGDFTTSVNVGELCYALNGCRNLDGSGTQAAGSVANSRYIQFMSFNKKDLVKNSQKEIISPFKKPSTANRIYRVNTDADYNGVITTGDTTSSGTGGPTATVNSGVGVWTYGDVNGTGNKLLSSCK